MRKVLPAPTIKQRKIEALPSHNRVRKMNRFKSIVASFLVLTFSVFGLSAAFSTPAQAGQVTDCPLDIDNNPWVQSLGGMSTRQYATLISGAALRKPDEELTIRDRWAGSVKFVSWMPAIKSGGWFYDPSKDVRKVAEFIPSKFADGSGTQFYIPKWEEYTDGYGSIPTRDLGPKELIRQGETYSVDILGTPLPCWWYTGRTTVNDLFPNFLMDMASGINSIATGLYVTANSGVNITQAVGINSEGIETDPSYESWVYSIGVTIEEFLAGEGGLYESLYLTMLIPLVFVGGLVIIFNGIRRQAIQVLTGIVWMVGVMVAGILFLTRPMMVPQVIDATVGTISSGINSAILGAGEEEKIGCEPAASASAITEGKRIAKRTECLIWYNTIYKTWSQGQFGIVYTGPKKNDDDYLNMGKIDQTTFNIGNKRIQYAEVGGWPAYQLHNGHNPLGANVAIHMSDNRSIGRGFFDGGDKWGSAFTAFAVSLTSAIFIAVNAILIIAYQIVTLLLLMVAPLFLLIGIIPSRTGKGIVLRWAELIVGIAVKRLVITILMAVFIKLFILIAAANLGFFLQAIIFGVLAVIGITQRTKILEMFTANINFGGDKSINVGNSIEKLGEKAPMLAGGVAGATAGWAFSRGTGAAKYAIASAKTDKFKRSLEGKTNEEKEQLIRAQEEKLNKKDMRRNILKGEGGSIAENERKLLDTTKDENRSSTARERNERIVDTVEEQGTRTRDTVTNTSKRTVEKINNNTNRAVGGSTASIIKNNRDEQRTTRDTVSAEGANTREVVTGSRDEIIANSNDNTERNLDNSNRNRRQLAREINTGFENTNDTVRSESSATRRTISAESSDTRANSERMVTRDESPNSRESVAPSRDAIIGDSGSIDNEPSRRVEETRETVVETTTTTTATSSPASEEVKTEKKSADTRANIEATRQRLASIRAKATGDAQPETKPAPKSSDNPPKPDNPPLPGGNKTT